ncbi:unnamed protein product [Ceutorhynchus assimilis]|uniref:Ubiquitin-like protease family profile domain-containing protein n=1 Tax=Ceutorhynchus assimilis TaxID=467358 RepID=A0A9N9QLN0_9CUCU|nr:unnamed protein product [Ceutorhynchus assimilis]
MPSSFRSQEINKLDSDLFFEGNWQGLRSLAVYQKARSEAFAEEDIHPDPLLDVLLRSLKENEENRYIHFPNCKTLVYLYSKDQIKTLVKKGQKLDAFFDATGSVVRSTGYDRGNRILYYSLVVNVDGIITPIAELVTSNHNSATLTSFNLHFKHFVRVYCHKKWPIFNVIVTDWSFPLMTSVCQGFNDVTLYTYLQLSYKFVTDKDDARFFNLIKLKLCCSHFIKMMCNKLSQLKQDRKIKDSIVSAIASLVLCTSFEKLLSYFNHVAVLLLSPMFDEDVDNAIDALANPSTTAQDLLSLREESSSNILDIDFEEDIVRGQYTTSPFFLAFFKIYENVSQNIELKENIEKEEKLSTNPYKSSVFFNYLLKRVMPFAPLWSDIMQCGRYSNSNVESWFKSVKHEILLEKTNLKLGRFICEIQRRIKSNLETIELSIGKKPHKIKKRTIDEKSIKNAMEIDNPAAVEKWKKPKKRKHFFTTDYMRMNIPEKLSKPASNDYAIETKTEGNKSDEDIKDIIHLSDSKESLSFCEFGKEHPNQIEVSISTQHEVPAKEKNELHTHREQPSDIALSNGLLLSNEYYNEGSSKVSFKFGTYSYLGQTITLTSSDFKTLASKYNKTHVQSVTDRWLTDYAIDCTSFSILADIKNIYYIDTISSSLILNDNMKYTNHSKFLPLVKPLDGIDIILLPYNVFDCHWILIVLYLKENKIYILNPGEMMPSEEKIFKKIKVFFMTRDRQNKYEKLNARKWKLDHIPSYPKQTDGYNCGVFVIYYIMTLSIHQNIGDCFSISNNSQELFDPEAFRITIQNILLI